MERTVTNAATPTNQAKEKVNSSPGSRQQQPTERMTDLRDRLGNRGAGLFLQAKLAVSHPDDSSEKEADRVAEQVLGSTPLPVNRRAAPTSPPRISRLVREGSKHKIRRQPSDEQEEQEQPIEPLNDEEIDESLQAKSTVVPRVTPSVANGIAGLRGRGEALPDATRSYFEPRFGYDFGQVRIHSGTEAALLAQSVKALAFTVGQDIVFGAGRFAPGTTGGDALLAHELTHVVQQGAEGPQLQRRKYETNPPHQVTDLGEGFTKDVIPSEHKTVFLFHDRPWVTVIAPAGAGFTSKLEPAGKGVTDAWVLKINSSARLEISIDRATENQILASIGGIQSGVAYEFACEGQVELKGANDESEIHQAPVRRFVRVSTSGTVVIPREGELDPPATTTIKREEAWINFELPDSYPSFDKLEKLREHLQANPQVNFIILTMPDGRFVARSVTERDLQQLASLARLSQYNPEEFEKVARYRGKFARGEFESMIIDGREYSNLDALSDLYFDNSLAAAIGSGGSSIECEVFEMGKSSFGRKRLSHAQAKERWKELDKLDYAGILQLETEPGRKFESLWVRGVSQQLHPVDREVYFVGRDDFNAAAAQALKVSPADALPKGVAQVPGTGAVAQFAVNAAAAAWARGLGTLARQYFLIEVDREGDRPEFAGLLKSSPGFAEGLAEELYHEVENRAQRIAIKTLQDSADEISKTVESEHRLLSFIYGFPQLTNQQQRESLQVFGVPENEVTKFQVILGSQRNALEIGLGNTVGGVSLELLRNHTRKNLKDLRDVIGKLENRDAMALTLSGAFGDSVRTLAYKEFGFNTLNPKSFPHRDRTESIFPSATEGRRSSFSSLGEQLYANKAKDRDSKETLETALKITAVVAAMVILILVANAAGAAIAGLLFAEGTVGFLATQAVVAGVIITGVELGVDVASGKQIDWTEAGEKLLVNIGTGLGFGALGKLLGKAGTAVRLGVEGAAFIGLSLGQFALKQKRAPNADELYWMLYENVLTFALLQAGAALSRPATKEIGLWARAKRLGENESKITDLIADVGRLNKELSAFAVKPQRAEAEGLALQQKQKDLLTRQKSLVEELQKSFRTRVEAAQLSKEVKAELDEINAALQAMEQSAFLSGLNIKAVGDSQTSFEYKPSPDAASKFKKFFPNAKITEEPGGQLRLEFPGEKEPLIFTPTGSAAAQPVKAAGAPAVPEKININTATAKELTKLSGIGEKRAKAIIEYREKKGPFAKMEDLGSVPGIGKETVAALIADPKASLQPPPPKPSLKEIQDGLVARRNNLLDRAARLDISLPDGAPIRKLQPQNRTTDKSLAEAEQIISNAEKDIGGKISQRAKTAKATATKRLGADAIDSLGKDTAGFTPEEIGDALYWANRYKVGKGLGLKELRGLLHAQRLGLDLEKFFSVARGQPQEQVSFTLETFASAADGRVSGVVRVLREMSVSGDKWRGGVWVLETARFNFGIENIKAFELPIEQAGVERDHDIVLKDGSKIELKNWGQWNADLAASLSKQFIKDVKLGGNDPKCFKQYRYIFRQPEPLSATEIKAILRKALSLHIKELKANGTLTAEKGQELIKAFDAESDLVTASPIRATGSVRAPAPVFTPVPAAPLQPPKKKEDEPAIAPVPAAPVQFTAGHVTEKPFPERIDSAQIHEAARAGTSGNGGSLPFLERIQHSFGRHDLRGVRTHMDSAAVAASARMGAEAFTRGNHVAFGKNPSLFTAAHEAAHVIQQRAGIQLLGGVGETDDKYEKHADEVARRVADGGSSEGLLDAFVSNTPPAEGQERARRDAEQADEQRGKANEEENVETGSSIQVRAVQRQEPKPAADKAEQKIAFKISFDQPLTRDEFIDLTERTIYGRRVNMAWYKVKDKYVPSDSPVWAWVPPATLQGNLKHFRENIDKIIENLGTLQDAATYQRLYKILQKLTPAQWADFEKRITGKTNDLDRFETAVDAYLASQKQREQEHGEKEELVKKLYGLDALYKKYKDWQFFADSGFVPPAFQKSFDDDLKANGFSSVSDFSDYIARYLKAFRTETIKIGFDLLELYDSALYKEQERYGNDAAVAELYQKLAPMREEYVEFKKNADIYNQYQKDEPQSRMPGGGGTLKTTRGEAMAAGEEAQKHKAAAQQSVIKISGEFPVFKEDHLPLDRRLDKAKMATADQAQLKALLLSHIKARRDDIAKTRETLTDSPNKVYSLDNLITLSRERQSIAPKTIFAEIIDDKISSDKVLDIVIGVMIGVIAVALSILSFGTGAIAVGAAVAGFGLSAGLAYKEFKDYEAKSAAYGTGLLSDEPSLFWVIVSVAGAAVDLAMAVKAVRAISPLAKAMKAPSDLARFQEGLKTLEKMGEIDSKIARSVEQAAAARAKTLEAAEGLSQALSKSSAIAGKLTNPDVYKQMVKMAYYRIRESGYAFEKFALEIQKAREAAKLGNLSAEELSKLKAAYDRGRSFASEEELLKFMEQSQGNFTKAADHMFGAGTIPKRAKGINGAHLRTDFDAALKGQGEVLNTTSIPGLNGAYKVEYKLYKMEKGKVTAVLQDGDAFVKTVFDPAVWDKSKLSQLAYEAFGGITKDGTHEVTRGGVTFIGWIRDGILSSFGVK